MQSLAGRDMAAVSGRGRQWQNTRVLENWKSLFTGRGDGPTTLAVRDQSNRSEGGHQVSAAARGTVGVGRSLTDLFLRRGCVQVDVLSPQDLLSSSETAADVVCFLYDVSNPESFAFCATIFLKYFYR